jgi:hypothetical protein
MSYSVPTGWQRIHFYLVRNFFVSTISPSVGRCIFLVTRHLDKYFFGKLPHPCRVWNPDEIFHIAQKARLSRKHALLCLAPSSDEVSFAAAAPAGTGSLIVGVGALARARGRGWQGLIGVRVSFCFCKHGESKKPLAYLRGSLPDENTIRR